MTDESYIKLAIEIAKKGRGRVSPNPLVGAVLVKDERIISVGYHEAFGGPHAEINAIRNAREAVEDSTLFINLEPCSHFGKTPPCVDMIIESRIKRVVIGTLDMNPLVCGRGAKKLIDAGIDIKTGVLEGECINLNKFFFKYITQKMPYVTLKIAQTIDGKIADIQGDSKWITSLPSRMYVHNMRNLYDAVLIGASTAKFDDPSLTVRYIEGRNPKRIVLDTHLRLSTKLKLIKDNIDGNLIIVTSKKSAEKKIKVKKLSDLGVNIIFIKENGNGTINLKNALSELAKNNISSVLVEGGSRTFSSFVRERLFDELSVFISPKLIGSGLPSIEKIGINSIQKAMKLKISKIDKIGDDALIEFTK